MNHCSCAHCSDIIRRKWAWTLELSVSPCLLRFIDTGGATPLAVVKCNHTWFHPAAADTTFSDHSLIYLEFNFQTKAEIPCHMSTSCIRWSNMIVVLEKLWMSFWSLCFEIGLCYICFCIKYISACIWFARFRTLTDRNYSTLETWMKTCCMYMTYKRTRNVVCWGACVCAHVSSSVCVKMLIWHDSVVGNRVETER